MKKIITLTLLFIFVNLAEAKTLRRDMFVDDAFNTGLSATLKSQAYLVHFITPESRRTFIDEVNAKADANLSKLKPEEIQKKKMLYGGATFSHVKEVAWDQSSKVLALVMPLRPAQAYDSQYTSSKNLYPVESAHIVDKDYKIICDPSSTREIFVDPEMMSYTDSIYGYHSKGILRVSFSIQPNVTAKLFEFNPECFNSSENIYLLVKSYLSKSAKSTIKKPLRDYIVQEFTSN